MLVIAEGLYLDWGSKEFSPPPGSLYSFGNGSISTEVPFFAEWVQFLVDEPNRVGKGREDLTELQERWNQAVASRISLLILVTMPRKFQDILQI